MKQVYEVAGISKQALHQHGQRVMVKANVADQFFEQANKIRKDHPGAGCRRMALELRSRGWGRDKLEGWLLQNGYRVEYPRNFTRTTYAQSKLYYPNLIEGLELSSINQVIQTDITYYRVKDRFYYLVFIIDVYSRRIVGYSVNKTMHATGNIQAVEMMLKCRNNDDIKGMIHHSDRGSQHIDKTYMALLHGKGIVMSMCKQAWENAFTERINRTIKRDYLCGWRINTYQELKARVAQAIKHYNTRKTHAGLGGKTPAAFEEEIKSVPSELRPKVKIYKKVTRTNASDNTEYSF